MAKTQNSFFTKSKSRRDHPSIDEIISVTIEREEGESKSQARRREREKECQEFDRQMQRTILRDQLSYFDIRMEYDSEILDHDRSVIDPSIEDIAEYCKYITLSCKMENEIPIIALVYVERILRKTGILMNKFNW